MYHHSPTDDILEAPIRSDSQEDMNSEDEDDGEDEDEDSGSGGGGTTAGGDDGSTVVVTVPTSDSVVAGTSGAVSAGAGASSNHTVITAVPTLESLAHLREVGLSDVVSWQLSSAKPGNGVEQLRDLSYDTYWQSDGVSQPHWIQIHLHRRLPLTHIALYLDYQLDESYTPKTVRVETGMTTQDLCAGPENMSMELNEPAGWCILPIRAPPDPLASSPVDESTDQPAFSAAAPPVKAHLIRLSVQSMHQNGRDTHIRRLALFCLRTVTPSGGGPTYGALAPVVGEDESDAPEHSQPNRRQESRNRVSPDFSSLGAHVFSTIR